MRISSLNYHFERAPIFTAKRYSSSQWIDVAEADGSDDSFAIFVHGGRTFEELEMVASALTAAWTGNGHSVVDGMSAEEA